MRMLSTYFSYLVTIAVLFSICCSKELREISSDQLQKRGDQLYYAINDDSPYTGKVVDLHPNGQKKMELNFNEGIQSGIYRTWYENGQLAEESNYENGKREGTYQTWHENGQLAKESNYVKGKREGTYRTWYKNGQPEKEGNYEASKREGNWHFWTQDGQKHELGWVFDQDGNKYQTVKIGTQWWMIENLKATHYRNGDVILETSPEDERRKGCYYSYDLKASQEEPYGYLYNWNAINDSRGLAPDGWHIPSASELRTLIKYLGGEKIAGAKMKVMYLSHWNSPNHGATNESGFSALPAGFYLSQDSTSPTSPSAMGDETTFWSSDLKDYEIRVLSLSSKSSKASLPFIEYLLRNDLYLSVRCVKD